MASEQSSQIGSGTLSFTRAILGPEQRGFIEGGQGHRYGTQVVVINPEDLNSVDAFATSGVTVGASGAVKLIGPDTNPLPRCRAVTIQNQGTGQIFIANREDANFAAEGFSVLAASAGEIRSITLPLLHNVEVWALASATTSVRLLIY